MAIRFPGRPVTNVKQSLHKWNDPLFRIAPNGRCVLMSTVRNSGVSKLEDIVWRGYYAYRRVKDRTDLNASSSPDRLDWK